MQNEVLSYTPKKWRNLSQARYAHKLIRKASNSPCTLLDKSPEFSSTNKNILSSEKNLLLNFTPTGNLKE